MEPWGISELLWGIFKEMKGAHCPHGIFCGLNGVTDITEEILPPIEFQNS